MNRPEINPRRVATDAFSGYVYQCYLGVERWLRLEDNEVLLCEGCEDLDIYVLGEAPKDESEQGEAPVRAVDLVQIKEYQELTTQMVRDVLANFLEHFRALDGQDGGKKFTLVTTAPPRGSLQRTLLDFLLEWHSGGSLEAIQEGVKKLFAARLEENEEGDEFVARIAWLDEGGDDRWTAFRDVVDWKLGDPGTDSAFQRIIERLGKLEGISDLPTDLLADRLILDIVTANREKEVRNRERTRAHLFAIIDEFRANLEEWRNFAPLRRVQDLRELSKILHPGTLAHQPVTETGLTSWGRLLTAAYEIVPFDVESREKELAFIAESCERELPLDVLLVHGEGGVGKTRLMIEVCQRLKRQGWIAGFLPTKTGEGDPMELLLSGERPRLAVLDYADARMPRLERLLAGIAAQEGKGGPKLRLVLISRTNGDWWKRLAEGPRAEGQRIADLLCRGAADASSQELAIAHSPIAPERRLFLFERAANAFRPLVDVEEPSSPTPAPPELGPLARSQQDDLFARPLYIHLAALAWLDGETVESAEGALRHALRHEKRFWEEQAANEGSTEPPRELEETLIEAITLLTLIGGAETKSAARGFLKRIDTATSVKISAVELLHRLYHETGENGTDQYYISPLTPDLLGEELVAQELARNSSLIDLALEDSTFDAKVSCLTVLTRLAQRRRELGTRLLEYTLKGQFDELAEAAFETLIRQGDPLGPIMAKCVESASNQTLDNLARLIDTVDHKNLLYLREVALTVTKAKLVNHLNSQAVSNGAEFSDLNVQLAERYASLGYYDEAVKTANHSVEVLRTLGDDEFANHPLNLAQNLITLASNLYSVGRWEDAKATASESLDLILSIHPENRTSEVGLSIAACLSILSLINVDLGESEEAVWAGTFSVEIFRLFCTKLPAKYSSPMLAGSLINLGLSLASRGDLNAAVLVMEEAVSIHRSLKSEGAEGHLSMLAASLNNLGGYYADLGRFKIALEVTEEAVEICQQLVSSRPQLFRFQLAMSLDNLGIRYGDLARPQMAQKAAAGASSIFSELANESPNQYQHYFARNLSNLSAAYLRLGDAKTALRTAQKAAGIWRSLVRDRPEVFSGDLATSLENVSSSAFENEDYSLGLATARESIEIYRKLSSFLPAAFSPKLASSLNRLSRYRYLSHHLENALNLAKEATSIYRVLAKVQPELYKLEVARSLNLCSYYYCSLESLPEAEEAARAACNIFKSFATTAPDSIRGDLLTALHNVGSRYSSLGQHHHALRVSEYSVQTYRDLENSNPGYFRFDLAGTLGILSDRLAKLERFVEAESAVREAIEIAAPYFLKFPAHTQELGLHMIREYRQRAAEAGISVDEDLLRPIEAKLAEINQDPGEPRD